MKKTNFSWLAFFFLSTTTFTRIYLNLLPSYYAGNMLQESS